MAVYVLPPNEFERLTKVNLPQKTLMFCNMANKQLCYFSMHIKVRFEVYFYSLNKERKLNCCRHFCRQENLAEPYFNFNC